MGESAIFDYVMIPMQDENGYKMTADKFAGQLGRQLKEQGVSASYRIEGGTILLMLDL